MHKRLLELIIHFDWDHGNVHKILNKHGVTPREAEEIFTSEKLIILDDVKHSGQEERYHAFGKSAKERKLFVALTIRDHTIRVISARDMDRRERRIYAEEEAKTAAEI